jgi:hypothetical protein
MLKSLFKKKSRKPVYDIFEKQRETLETKKCLNCLRRILIHYNRCPYCGKDNFQFNIN